MICQTSYRRKFKCHIAMLRPESIRKVSNVKPKYGYDSSVSLDDPWTGRKARSHTFLSIKSNWRKSWFVYITKGIAWRYRKVTRHTPSLKAWAQLENLCTNQVGFVSRSVILLTRVNSYDPSPSCVRCERPFAWNAQLFWLAHCHKIIMTSYAQWWKDEVDLSKPKVAHRRT